MSRHAMFGVLLATGLVIAAGSPAAQQAAAAADGQATTGAAQGPAVEPAARTEETQRPPDETEAQTDEGAKLTPVPGGKALGMSILGNQEAPTALVIVPWKTSELGGSLGVTPMLDDSRQPVDKDVFMRSLRYYEIRSEKKP
jgi:nucleoid-associated protein YgaU